MAISACRMPRDTSWTSRARGNRRCSKARSRSSSGPPESSTSASTMPSSSAPSRPPASGAARVSVAQIPIRPENHGSGSRTSEIGLYTLSPGPQLVPHLARRPTAPSRVPVPRAIRPVPCRACEFGVTANMYMVSLLSGMYPALTPSAW